MRIVSGLLLAALVLGALAAASAAADKADVKVGDKAPTFQAAADDGKEWKSSDHVGKKVLVLYFYPADFTGGCTRQACAYRDESSKLNDKNVEVVGISGDSAKNHEMFKKFHKLNFTLLADEDGALAKKFGVPVNKGGEITVKELDNTKIKRGVTIERWTVVIGKDGKVIYKGKVSAPAEDAKNVLDVIEKQAK
jgi:peroxiredoxin Q/BCP